MSPQNMEYQEEWSSNANEAVEISIVQAGQQSPVTLSSFNPQFTYPIFGEEERIFGYQGLRISIRFAAHDLLPNVRISFDKKFKAVGDTQAADIQEILKDWVPSSAFDKPSEFDDRLQNDSSAKDFKPPGELIESYTSRGRNFEIWQGELTDPAVKELIRRIQIVISFFIEGGTPLELDDEEWTQARWRVFFLYEKLPSPPHPNASRYSIAGYSTSYHFLAYKCSTQKPQIQTFLLPPSDPISPASLPSRARISQFLVLPPHQGHSHGTRLFTTMTKTLLSTPTVWEITVEDPNEAFDDLRDYTDYTRLQANDTFSQVILSTNLPPTLTTKRIGSRVPTSKLLDLPRLESLRRQNKLAPRQFARLVEMYLLSRIPPETRQRGTARLTQRGKSTDSDDRAYYYWRLLVKQRVYKQNRDLLAQLERIERIDKVEQTVGEVLGDYERLLQGLASRQNGGVAQLKSDIEAEAGGAQERTGRIGRKEGRKRKILADEDEDKDEDEDEGLNKDANRPARAGAGGENSGNKTEAGAVPPPPKRRRAEKEAKAVADAVAEVVAVAEKAAEQAAEKTAEAKR